MISVACRSLPGKRLILEFADIRRFYGVKVGCCVVTALAMLLHQCTMLLGKCVCQLQCRLCMYISISALEPAGELLSTDPLCLPYVQTLLTPLDDFLFFFLSLVNGCWGQIQFCSMSHDLVTVEQLHIVSVQSSP